jgi:hypothetical protein
MTDARPAPYPADTRAKGWRFELDYERIEQSATWGLTTLKPEARPWLLMTWYTAWKQTPCGSMPGDPEVFAGLIGASDATFTKHRKILLRGWWLADDGRLYHDTLVQRVLEMLKQRRGDADRQAANRAKKAAGITGVSHVTPAAVQGESSTGTGTSTGTTKTEDGQECARAPEDEGESLPDTTGWTPTPGGLACRAIKAAGIPDVNPSHIDLQRLLSAGVTPQELADAAAVCALKGKPSFAYLLSTVEGQRRDAAAKAAVPAEVAKPVTVASSEAEKTAAMLAQQSAVKPTKPPAHLLALAGKAVRTA